MRKFPKIRKDLLVRRTWCSSDRVNVHNIFELTNVHFNYDISFVIFQGLSHKSVINIDDLVYPLLRFDCSLNRTNVENRVATNQLAARRACFKLPQHFKLYELMCKTVWPTISYCDREIAPNFQKRTFASIQPIHTCRIDVPVV